MMNSAGDARQHALVRREQRAERGGRRAERDEHDRETEHEQQTGHEDVGEPAPALSESRRAPCPS